jgi:tetratricopeptide (TPR) repeat protein
MFLVRYRKRFVCLTNSLIIISLFLFWETSPGFAQNANTNSLIVRSQKDGLSDAETEDAVAALRKVLPQIGNIQIISPQLVHTVLAYQHKKESVPSKDETEAMDILARAKEHYFSFHYAEAMAEVSQAVDFFSQGDISSRGALLQDALLTQGLIAKAAGQKKVAREAFLRAVRLDPFYKINRTNFPPSIVKLYERQQNELFKGAMGSLTVETGPAAAEVYINGILQGVTPLTFEEIPAGTYALFIKTNKYQPLQKTITINDGLEIVLQEKLNWLSQTGDSAEPSPALNTQELIHQGVEQANLLAADKVVFVNCDEGKGGNVLVARMIDRKYRAAYRGIVYHYQSIEERPQAIAEVAKILAIQAEANLLDDPLQYLDPDGLGDPILLGNRKKAYYKKPLFWGIIGAAAAALAGGLIFGLSSSGSGGASPDTGSVNVQFK